MAAPNSDHIRAFIAVAVPDALKSILCGIQEDLKRRRIRARWVLPESMHLTLKFLGDAALSDVEMIRRAMTAAAEAAAPMTLAVKGVGVFPGVRRPNVIWTGIHGQTDELADFHADLDSRLAELGFLRENRKFTGHLTLGRFKDRVRPDQCIELIQAYAGLASDPFVVEAVHLYKSDLLPSGAVHSRLFTAPLKR